MTPKRIVCKPSALSFGFVVIAAVLMMAGLTSAQCTPSTCPDTPVFAYFQNSDCTGDVVYHPELADLGECQGNQIIEELPDALVYTRFYDASPTCDRSISNASYEIDIFVFGACRPEATNNALRGAVDGRAPPSWQAYMVLRNVNDSYSAPYNFDNRPLATYYSQTENCYSVDNCTMANNDPAEIWQTIFDSTCQNAAYSRVDIYDYAGECRNYYGVTYYKAGCFEEHGMYEGWFLDAACKQPSQLFAVRSTCTSGSQTTWHCSANPTPLPFVGNTNTGPQTPTSTAGLILPSSSLVFILIALFAIIGII